MWRRLYLFLVLVRLWFALSPSYLHPDENFQGPEVIAGMLIDLVAAATRVVCVGRAQLFAAPWSSPRASGSSH